MKYFLIAVIAVVGIVFLGNQVFIPANQGYPSSFQNATYKNSQVDTIWYGRDAGLSGLSFAPYWADSMSVTSLIVRRVVNGTILPVIANDTLATAISGTSAKAKLYNIIVGNAANPIPEIYVVIVTYADSLNGVTTPNVTYRFVQEYTAK